MKNKLVLRADEFTSFHSVYLQYLWQRYFDIEYYDPDKTYDRPGKVFVVNWQNADDDYSKQLKNQGHRVAVDNLWEHPLLKKDHHWIQNPNWFWYNQSIWWRSLGCHRYRPNKTYSKLAFMPIERQDAVRDYIVKKLDNRLDNFIWSYRSQKLPDDISSHPQWHDDTYFSVVVEIIQGIKSCQWLSEKSFKPIAYRHPFLLMGQPGSLKKLHGLGFETYENLFDESYDDITIMNQRFDAIIKNVDNFIRQEYDSLTLEKLQHNHAHFFNKELVESRIVSEIIEPLIHYIET